MSNDYNPELDPRVARIYADIKRERNRARLDREVRKRQDARKKKRRKAARKARKRNRS